MSVVLVVDDDQVFVGAIARQLSDQGHQVLTACSVSEAEDALLHHRPQVMLTDLHLGPEDGIDLIQKARQISHRTRAILMSEHATARDYRTAVEAGAVTVLCKPFEATELLEAIERALECESGFRGNLHGLSLIDLMQMFHLTRRSICLVVKDGEFQGTISFRHGELIDARWREKIGLDALSSLLASSYGTVETVPARDAEQTIRGSFDSIVLDTLRRLDESGPASSRGSVHKSYWPTSMPPSSGESEIREIMPLHADTELADFEDLVAQARTGLLNESWTVEVLRNFPHGEHFAAQAVQLALTVDPTAAQIELIRGGRALGIVLHRDLAVVVSSELSGLQASQHFRTQFARFAALVRVERNAQERSA